MGEGPNHRSAARALPIDAVLFDLDGTLADTAPDLGAALNRLRLGRGLDPVPILALRSSSSHGARGLLRVGMGIAPEHPEYAALRDAFLAHYEAALCVDSKLFAEVDALLDAIEARSLKWGIVTNKATRYTAPLLEQLGLAGAPARSSAATPHPIPSRIRPRCWRRPVNLGSLPRGASTSATRSATSRPASPPECARSSPATVTSKRTSRRRPGLRMAASIIQPRCLGGCPRNGRPA